MPKSKPGEANLRLVAWEVTRSCNLACVHCRAAAHMEPYEGELGPEASFRLLDQIAEVGQPIVILTGGEPLLRPDIFDLAKYGTDKGLRMVMSPNGTLITEDTARKMADSGIKRISISIDGSTAESHDAFRGVEGSFEASMRGIKYATDAGIEFQINNNNKKEY
jgi:MoaA/NifB/PqqE/SkfB family radical SAM enzyme